MWFRSEAAQITIRRSREREKATVERLARFNMKIFSGVHYAYRHLDVQLGRGRRDEVIETYCQFLRDCGKLGIPVSNYDWHPANTYTTAIVDTPRGYRAREFSVDDFRKKVEKQAFEREYSADDIWETYTYFMKAVLPVAEKANVRLALHPDDPPLAKMNGVAKVLTHYDGYARAEKIAGNSKHWGLTFCVGTWSEGGTEMGKDVFLLLDSITRLARAFNKWVGNNGPTMTGGVNIKAMDIPKKLFASARAFAEGGSLTIVGTALIDTGSRMDDLIFQEFKGTGNMEIVLDRRLSDRRVFPAIDITQSGTRREELLHDEETLNAVHALRRTLNTMHPVEAMEQLTKQLARFPSNKEFIRLISAAKVLD